MAPEVTQQGLGIGQVAAQTVVQTQYISKLFDPANTTLTQFFNALFFTAIAIGAILAVLRLGYAGIIYMTTDVITIKGNAREIISHAILGLLLLLAVYIILFQINPEILELCILRSLGANACQ